MTTRTCEEHGASMALGHLKAELAGGRGDAPWHWICPAGHTVPAGAGEEPASSDPRITFPA